MKTFRLLPLSLAVIAATCLAQEASDVKVSYGEIIDTRCSSQRSTHLQINLKLIGERTDGAQEVRADVKRAVDDTGRDLIDSQTGIRASRLVERPSGQAECMVQLQNPARRATLVKELEGEMSAFVPQNDPAATVEFGHIISHVGETLTNAALQAAKVELTILTREQFNEIKNKEDAESLSNRMGAMMGRPPVYSRYSQVDENSLVLKVSDPKTNLVAIEFFDQSGKKVRPRMTMGTELLRIYSFSQAPSPDMSTRILLSTPKSMVKVPFKLVDIPLP